MWNVSIPALVELRTTYIHRYAALPTNTQFGERGVKESKYASLGRRNEPSRSILAISRGTLLPEALAAGHSEIECPDENKKRQLQGKQKAKVLMREFFVHNKKIESLLQKRKREGNNIKVERKAIRTTLTNPTVLFKTKRTDEKICHILSKANDNPPPNVYQRRVGQTLTPLIEGQIQYGKLLKRFNLDAVMDKLTKQELRDKFDKKTNWSKLIMLLKEHEKNDRHFIPLTDYDKFKWNCNHIGTDGELI